MINNNYLIGLNSQILIKFNNMTKNDNFFEINRLKLLS